MKKMLTSFWAACWGMMLVGVVEISCTSFETGYFKGKVNEASQEIVANRYGKPHVMKQLDDGGLRWTYYDRGSSTASYSGYSMNKFCRAYVLTFDKEGMLRDWQQQHCSN